MKVLALKHKRESKREKSGAFYEKNCCHNTSLITSALFMVTQLISFRYCDDYIEKRYFKKKDSKTACY